MRRRTTLVSMAVMAVMLLGLLAGCESVGKGVSGQLLDPCEGLILFQLEGQTQIMNANGSNPTRLADGGDPAWSPDGKKIAFVSADSAIYTMGSDGSNPNLVRKFERQHMLSLDWQ
jgi:hypothetical protein